MGTTRRETGEIAWESRAIRGAWAGSAKVVRMLQLLLLIARFPGYKEQSSCGSIDSLASLRKRAGAGRRADGVGRVGGVQYSGARGGGVRSGGAVGAGDGNLRTGAARVRAARQSTVHYGLGESWAAARGIGFVGACKPRRGDAVEEFAAGVAHLC